MTANLAASRTRTQILRHISRLRKQRKWRNGTVTQMLDEVCGFIRRMGQRANKRVGGLGRH